MCMMLDNIVLRPSRQPEHPSPSPCTARCLRQSSLGQITATILLATAGRAHRKRRSGARRMHIAARDSALPQGLKFG